MRKLLAFAAVALSLGAAVPWCADSAPDATPTVEAAEADGLPAALLPAPGAPLLWAASSLAVADGSCAGLAESMLSAPLAVEASTSGCCSATCQSGSSVICCGTSCSATDAACMIQQGFCWSNTEGYKYCPACGCPGGDCGCHGLPCTQNSQCGTCAGLQCKCLGPTGNKHCACP
jgi:hypothetical protein